MLQDAAERLQVIGDKKEKSLSRDWGAIFVWCCVVLCSVVQYCVEWCSIVQYCVVLCRVVQYCVQCTFLGKSLNFPCFPRYPFVTISLPSGSFLTRCVNFPTIFLRDSKSPSWHLILLSSSHLAPHYTTLHNTTQHYTILHHTTPHYTTLHNTTQHYTILHYTTLHHFLCSTTYFGAFCRKRLCVSKKCSNFAG